METAFPLWKRGSNVHSTPRKTERIAVRQGNGYTREPILKECRKTAPVPDQGHHYKRKSDFLSYRNSSSLCLKKLAVGEGGTHKVGRGGLVHDDLCPLGGLWSEEGGRVEVAEDGLLGRRDTARGVGNAAIERPRIVAAAVAAAVAGASRVLGIGGQEWWWELCSEGVASRVVESRLTGWQRWWQTEDGGFLTATKSRIHVLLSPIRGLPYIKARNDPVTKVRARSVRLVRAVRVCGGKARMIEDVAKLQRQLASLEKEVQAIRLNKDEFTDLRFVFAQLPDRLSMDATTIVDDCLYWWYVWLPTAICVTRIPVPIARGPESDGPVRAMFLCVLASRALAIPTRHLGRDRRGGGAEGEDRNPDTVRLAMRLLAICVLSANIATMAASKDARGYGQAKSDEDFEDRPDSHQPQTIVLLPAHIPSPASQLAPRQPKTPFLHALTAPRPARPMAAK
ncbi:hypothetical protein BC938DRAFT_484142 [Jimgerdemannia flammicorona]|uniref:Uncharacterized protein n=1 Tax=Jimgerdemannia flammicorona TaxID=994334 RepID=A0A433QVB7_9FUNG|nr:hypothetical protein BC938DRAFT_484142 [Jimgerdemannia flammicorona]